MNEHARRFYSEFSEDTPQGNFYRVIYIQDLPDLSWGDARKIAPGLSKGWYELSRLSPGDRVAFTRDYWKLTLPYIPHVDAGITDFFSRVEDVSVLSVQKLVGEEPEAILVYSLKNNEGYFHGGAPSDEGATLNLQQYFSDHLLPEDFLAFLKIHDGFAKCTDTGIAKTLVIPRLYREFQEFLDSKMPLETLSGKAVNPRQLIPFYESFGMHCYQCFWGDWYPEQEMGNVYYCGLEHSLLDHEKGKEATENLAFSTFIDWLAFYLVDLQHV